ncbi:MAG: hypothetical protein PHF79_02665 [Candidatus Pacebacteria bacterium]|nr:hypothetical protein [Candidatus Paceibacterota bacterium]
MIKKLSFIVLALLIIGGVYWYVKSKPSSPVISTEVSPEASSTLAINTSTSTAPVSKNIVAATSSVSVAPIPADWKTYTNTTYGFSLRYPKDLAPHEVADAYPGSRYAAMIAFYPAQASTSSQPDMSVSSRSFYVKVYTNVGYDNTSIPFTDEISSIQYSEACNKIGFYPTNTTVGTGQYPAREIYFNQKNKSCLPIYFFSISQNKKLYHILPLIDQPADYDFDGIAEVKTKLPEFSQILASLTFK